MTYSFHVPWWKKCYWFFSKNPLKFKENYPWKQQFSIGVLVKSLLRCLSVVRGHQYGKMGESLAPEIPVSAR